jgi:hypothetical protein
MRKQVVLGLDAARETGETAISAYDPVAGRDDRDRVPAVRGADGAHRLWVADRIRDLPVGARVSPYGIANSAFQTLLWNSMPTKSRSMSNASRSPAKYSRSCCSARFRIAWSGLSI